MAQIGCEHGLVEVEVFVRDSVAFPLVRLAAFVSNAILFGSAMFLLLVLRPAFAGLPSDEWTDGRRWVGLRIERLVRATLIGSAMATVLGLVLYATQFASLNETDLGYESFTQVLELPFGVWYVIRFPLIIALALILVRRVEIWGLAQEGQRGGSRSWWGGWIVLGLGVLATNSFAGHAAAGTPKWLSLTSDIIHLGAGSVWFAGIVLLSVVLPDAWIRAERVNDVRLLAPVVDRFSNVAFVAIMVVLVTGVVNSFMDVAKLSDFVNTPYGRTLALKIIVFVGVLALGGLNHFVVRERLRRERESDNGAASSVAVFRKAIAAELAIGLVLMALTAWLTGQAKTRQNVVERPSSVTVGDADRQ